MKTTACPMCDAVAEERRYSESVEQDGKKYKIDELRRFVCTKCETVFVDEEQSRHNLVRTQLALGEETRYLLPAQIKSWRADAGLTQRDAARLLGGGLNAFSKYETGEITQSDAMDNLIWVVMKYPGLLIDLAKRKGIQLSAEIRERCGYVFQFSNSRLRTFDFIVQSQTGDAALTELAVWNRYLALTIDSMDGWKESSFVISAANDQTFVYGEPEARAA